MRGISLTRSDIRIRMTLTVCWTQFSSVLADSLGVSSYKDAHKLVLLQALSYFGICSVNNIKVSCSSAYIIYYFTIAREDSFLKVTACLTRDACCAQEHSFIYISGHIKNFYETPMLEIVFMGSQHSSGHPYPAESVVNAELPRTNKLTSNEWTFGIYL